MPVYNTIKLMDILQLLPLSMGDMMICSPEASNIARGRRVDKSSCQPYLRATIVLLYRTTFETNKRHAT